MLRLILSIIVCGALCSCQDSGVDPDRPQVVPVSGTITYQGKPLPEAVVTYYPVTGEQSAFGRTDEAGHYVLTTFESNDGAVAGDYSVVVQKYEEPVPTGSPEGENYVPPTNVQQAPPKLLTPAAYVSPQTTPLKATVKPDGENKFDFELK